MKKIIAVILSVVAVMSFMLIPANAEEKTVKDIWVIKQPDKMEYFVGEKFDLTGIQIGVAYSDGTYETVESGIQTNTEVFDHKGTYYVEISYMGEPEIMTVKVDYTMWQKVLTIILFLGSFFGISAKNIIEWF